MLFSATSIKQEAQLLLRRASHTTLSVIAMQHGWQWQFQFHSCKCWHFTFRTKVLN